MRRIDGLALVMMWCMSSAALAQLDIPSDGSDGVFNPTGLDHGD